MYFTDKIIIASDHAGYEMKEALKTYLNDIQVTVIDKGTHSADSVDYPDYAKALCKSIEDKEASFGILLCGSANGVAMTANKFKYIRAAICWNSKVAELARMHNNANVICLPARFLSLEEAKSCIDMFFTTEFEGGRHSIRVKKMC